MHMMSIVQNVCNWKTMRIGELKNDKKQQQQPHHHHQQQQWEIKKTKKSEPNWSWLALYNVLSPLFACKTDKEIHIAHWKKKMQQRNKQTNHNPSKIWEYGNATDMQLSDRARERMKEHQIEIWITKQCTRNARKWHEVDMKWKTQQTIQRMEKKSNLHILFTQFPVSWRSCAFAGARSPLSLAFFHQIFFQFITEHVCRFCYWLSEWLWHDDPIWFDGKIRLWVGKSGVLARCLSKSDSRAANDTDTATSNVHVKNAIFFSARHRMGCVCVCFLSFFSPGFSFKKLSFLFFMQNPSFLFKSVVFVCRLILCHSVSESLNEYELVVFLCLSLSSYLCIPFSLFNGDYFALFFPARFVCV